MEKILELKLRYAYSIKNKKRPRINKYSRYNPSEKDELQVENDTITLITELSNKMDLDLLKEIKSYQSRNDIAVEVHIDNIYWTKTKKHYGYPKLTSPDVDNFIKLFCDANNGFLWNDDRIVYKMSGSKTYGPLARATVTIKYYKI